MNVLFLCTGNACRSQMAEGFGKSHGVLEVASAGTEPQGVHPSAIAAMAEVGIDLSGHTSDKWTPEMLANLDTVITLCGAAQDRCPVLPAGVHRIHWDLEDPAALTGTEGEVMTGFRAIRDDIGRRVADLARDVLESRNG